MDQPPIEEAPVLGEEQILGLPGGISEGMPVFDRADAAVGTVQLVYYGGASDEAIARALRLRELVGSAASDTEGGPPEGGTFDVAVPPDLQARLMRYGYIRVEGPGITGLSCYVTPEQIAGLVGGQVQLHSTRAELIAGRA